VDELQVQVVVLATYRNFGGLEQGVVSFHYSHTIPLYATSKLTRSIALRHFSSMSYLWFIYLILRIRYEYNPGKTFEFALFEQMHSFLRLRSLLISTEEVYGLRILRPYSLIPMSVLAWVIFRVWQELPKMVRQHTQIAATINLPLYFLFCVPGEMRDLSMLYVALLFTIAVNLQQWLGKFNYAQCTPQNEF